jgi:CRP/FNR family transcriptional regulator
LRKYKRPVTKKDKFALKGRQYRFKKGQLILRPDINPSGVYYIEKGFVRVYYLTESGREKLHIIYKAGELFPLLFVLRSIHKDAYYEAMTDVLCRKIESDVFLKAANNPVFAQALVSRLTDLLNIFIKRLDTLETHKGEARVISRLLSLAERFGRYTKNGILIEVPITHKDIADSIALNRESVSRKLEELAKKRLIRVTRHKFYIPDVNSLRNELQVKE